MPSIKDAKKFPIHQEYFSGGVSIDPKLAVANSFYYSQNLDFRSQPSQISVLPGSRQLASNLTGLITAMEQDLNGVRYGIATDGSLYRINTSNVLSKIAQITEAGSAGLLYNQISDQLYIPGQTSVSMYGQVTTGATGNPAFRSNIFGKSASVAPGCTNLYDSTDGFFDGAFRNDAQSVGQTGGITNPNQVGNPYATNNYLLPSVIIEATGNFCFFAPDIEPFYSIAVYVAVVGAGSWTLTLHDSLNNQLAAVTITHANMVVGWNEFVFGKQVRGFVNASQIGNSATYHFHLTSSTASDTAAAAVLTTQDLTTSNFLLFAYRMLQTNNGWHPTALFTGSGQPLLCIGNGPYLSTYNFGNDASPTNGQWQRHNLTFKSGDEVCGLSANNQYLVIAVERRSTNSSRNFQRGALYFWSGTTNSPDFVVDVPMGAPYGLYTFNNVTYFACAGSLFAWSGGQTVIKVRKLAYQNTDFLNAVDSTLVNPNMFTSRYNLLMMGYPSSTTNININYGTWSWGAVELTFPNSYGLSYTLSNGLLNFSTSNKLQIGCIQNFVDTMYTSWSYVDTGGITRYGLDILDNFSTPAATASWQSLIYDGGVRYKIKKALRYKLNFIALPTGATVTATYSIDRGAWVTTDPTSGVSFTATAGATNLVLELNNARFHELQWGFNITESSAATDPVRMTGVTMEVDALEDEVDVRKDG